MATTKKTIDVTVLPGCVVYHQDTAHQEGDTFTVTPQEAENLTDQAVVRTADAD